MSEAQAAGNGAMIEVAGLVKRYGRTEALRGLHMQVPKGAIYGFVGPNGAGKTTTMRFLATLLAVDSGSARIAGLDVRNQPSRVRAAIGYMPDFFGLYEDLTVTEYLDFYATSYGVPVRARKRTIGELLELVDLVPRQDDYVEGLSRGMKQRLGLARCLVHDPEVLLLDEPASGMDPRARVEMREIVRELSRLGKTILISSHILLELAEMCTHIGIIQSGTLLREGPVQEIVRGLQGGRVIELQVLHDEARALQLLQGQKDLCEVAQAPDSGALVAAQHHAITFRVADSDQRVYEVLQMLMAAGVPVLAYAQQRDTLEEVFMQLTALPETKD